MLFRSGGGGVVAVSEFIDLTDVFLGTYAGKANYAVIVNDAETGLVATDDFYMSLNGSVSPDIDANLTHGIYNYGSWTNYPAGSSPAGSLIVASNDDGATSAKTQLYIASDHRIWYRYGSGTAPFTWYAWNVAATEAYVDTADALNVKKTGDTMTGNLTIYSSNSALFLQNSSASEIAQVVMLDDSGIQRFNMRYNDSQGAGQLILRDAAQAIIGQMTLNTDGNVSISALVPTSTAHLTRKDYVDNERPQLGNQYLVPISTWVPIVTPNSTGTLDGGYAYKVIAFTQSTGTRTGEKWNVYYALGSWTIQSVSISGIGSNRPLLRVSGGDLEISHSHTTTTYNIRVHV